MDDKVMTIREFVCDAEDFQYTKEYYDFVKECYELELMEMYMDSKEFLEENVDMDSDRKVLFLSESTEIDEPFMEKVSEKIGNLFGSIARVFKNIFKALITVLKKLGPSTKDKVVNLTKKIDDTIDRINDDGTVISIAELKKTRELINKNMVITVPKIFTDNSLISEALLEIDRYLKKLQSIAQPDTIASIVGANLVGGAISGTAVAATGSGVVTIPVALVFAAMMIAMRSTAGVTKRITELNEKLKESLENRVEIKFAYSDISEMTNSFETHQILVDKILDMVDDISKRAKEIANRGILAKTRDVVTSARQSRGSATTSRNLGDKDKAGSIINQIFLTFTYLKKASAAYIKVINERKEELNKIESEILKKLAA